MQKRILGFLLTLKTKPKFYAVGKERYWEPANIYEEKHEACNTHQRVIFTRRNTEWKHQVKEVRLVTHTAGC